MHKFFKNLVGFIVFSFGYGWFLFALYTLSEDYATHKMVESALLFDLVMTLPGLLITWWGYRITRRDEPPGKPCFLWTVYLPVSLFLKVFVLGDHITREGFSPWWAGEVINGILTLVALFGFITRRKYLSFDFWRKFFFVYVLWEIGCYIGWDRGPLLTGILQAGSLAWPTYLSLYLYVFRFRKYSDEQIAVMLEREAAWSPSAGKRPKPRKRIVVGFMQRALMDFIDVLILGIGGFVFAVLFHPFLYKIGEDGLWIGVLITFLYTGILQSRIGKGQSLAKKMFRVEVLRRDGSYMSLPRSFFRFVVLWAIYYHQTLFAGLVALVPALNRPQYYDMLIYLLLLLTTGNFVLMAAHPVKRALHDLIADSIVVRKGRYDPRLIRAMENPRRVRRAFLIWFIVFAAVAAIYNHTIVGGRDWGERYRELSKHWLAMRKEVRLENIYLQDYEDPLNKKEGGYRFFFMSGFLKRDIYENRGLMKEIVQEAVNYIVRNYAFIEDSNRILVRVRTGLNIGIFHSYWNEDFIFDTRGNLLEEPDKDTEAVFLGSFGNFFEMFWTQETAPLFEGPDDPRQFGEDGGNDSERDGPPSLSESAKEEIIGGSFEPPGFGPDVY